MKTRLKAQEPAKTDKRIVDTQLLKLYSACQNNADELLKESRLLLTHGHHARAYFLAYTAREELCKAQVVADFSKHRVTELEFKKAFRNHTFKAAYLDRNVEIPENWEDDVWLITYDEESSKDAVSARERSLYVEFRPDHSPQVPQETFSTESLEKFLSGVEKYLSEIREREYITGGIGTEAFVKHTHGVE